MLNEKKGGSAIRLLRVARGLAQADLAAACGVSAGTMSNIESGRAPVSRKRRTQLARALRCRPQALSGSREALTEALTAMVSSSTGSPPA